MITAPQQPAQPEAYWKATDVARFLAVSKQWVYKHAALGHLPSARMQGNLRFKVSEIRAYAERCSRAKAGGKLLSFPNGGG